MVGAIAVTGAVTLVLAGCTADQDQVTDPSRVLQTVDTTLTTNGAVRAVSDTTISVSGTRSSSRTVDHDVADAAGDLPLRITTQYTTQKRSGTDLADLDGYSGRVEIDVTVENLTVRSQDLSYDVAGAARSTPALVGAPFSVAASTVLTGVAPDRIVTGSADGGASTDGVVSTDPYGDAVVQWGRLLAPPTSGASSTLHLVADVEDFTPPAIDIAAQPGLTTDLSTSGVMSGAFGSDTDSELALQRRTIDLIAQVNEVLARAGGTITEVRTNLESTSETLGVRTAERLQESSASLATTMRSLAGELGSLNGDLGSTVQTTQSTVLQQLQETTSSLDALLGDTSATAPAPVLDGAGCAAAPKTEAAGSSVYGNLLRVSAQLEGYAEASEACKQQVSAQLSSSVGPASPSAEACAAQEARGSLTCALWESSAAVNTSLIGLVSKGQQLAAGLDPDLSDKAIEQSAALNAQLQTISQKLTALGSDQDGSVEQALSELDALVTSSADAVRPVQDALASVNGRARAARVQLGALDSRFDGTVQAQNRALADRLCELARPGLLTSPELDQDEVDALRGYLTASPCPGTDQPEGTTLRPGPGFATPMDQRLAAQATAWDALIAETDQGSASGVGAAVRDLATAVGALRQGVENVRTAIRTDGSSVAASVAELQGLLQPAITSGGVVSDQLQQVSDQQAQLQDAVRAAFQQASDDSAEQVQALIDEQVRKVSATAGSSRQAVVDAFDKSIVGLRATSGEVTSDSKGTIDEQKGSLEEQSSGLASSVDRQTAASLQRIDASTSASVRDVQGASTLLTGDLNRVMLDLGDRKVNGSGILGAMATSAAKSDSADYQLALASQNASGYANVRAEDVAGILLQQEQFRASLDRAAKLPAFRLHVPRGATSTTLYAFRIGAER